MTMTDKYFIEVAMIEKRSLRQTEWEGRVHAGNTTYTADSNPNSTKPRQENNMNVNGYKNIEDTQKQTNIY